MKYTLVLAKRRAAPRGTIEFWDLVLRHTFNHPKHLVSYLRGKSLFFRGLPYSDNLKVELHEGETVTAKHMRIRSVIPKGKRVYRPCVHFPNGNVQELTEFLNHWKLQLQASK